VSHCSRDTCTSTTPLRRRSTATPSIRRSVTGRAATERAMPTI
jgi:hypothetical protein